MLQNRRSRLGEGSTHPRIYPLTERLGFFYSLVRQNPMAIFKLAALTLTAIGFGFAVAGIVKYSDFLTRLHKVAPSDVDGLALDTNPDWSTKNWRIGVYFWRKEYLAEDTVLNALGDSVRRFNIVAALLLLAAAILMLFGGVGG